MLRTSGTTFIVVFIAGSAGCGAGMSGRGGATVARNPPAGATSVAPVLHPAVQSIPAGDNPHNVLVAGGAIWVADFGGPVREFDTRGHQLRIVKLDEQSMAPGPSALWIGVLSNSNTGPQGPLAEVDARTGRVLRRLATRDPVDVLAVGGGAVWAASRFARRITRISLPGGAQRTVRLPGTPTAIALGTGSVWVAYGQAGTSQAVGQPETGSGGVVKLNPTTGRQTAQQTEGAVPTALVVAHGAVWVALPDDLNDLDRIDEATGRSVSSAPTVSVGRQPTDLAFANGSVWALNYSDATVTRIDPATGRPTATVAFAAPTNPDRLAANTPIRLAVTRGTLWVTDAEANTLRRLPDR
jgi:sugar lactone lactonase YvrE